MLSLKTFFGTGLAAALALALGIAAAAAPARAGIEVTAVTARAPIIEGRPGVAYFTIKNTGDKADRLLSVQSPVIGRIELHESIMGPGNMASMKPVKSLEIPAHGEMVFKPGSYHAMLFNISKQALEKPAPLIFTFENAGKITVEATIAPAGEMMHMH